MLGSKIVIAALSGRESPVVLEADGQGRFIHSNESYELVVIVNEDAAFHPVRWSAVWIEADGGRALIDYGHADCLSQAIEGPLGRTVFLLEEMRTAPFGRDQRGRPLKEHEKGRGR